MARLRLIPGDVVRELFTTANAASAMEAALIQFSGGHVEHHPRVTIQAPGDDAAVLVMPAASMQVRTIGIKVLSMFSRSVERALPSVQGLVILIDATYGEPLAIIDGTAVTEIRTAAVTCVATERLARPDASVLAIIGAGVQARGHLQALAAIRPWKSIRLWSRTEQRTTQCIEWGRSLGITVEAAGSADDAVRDADVICTLTSSCQPVLSAHSVPREGVHINAIGAFGPGCRELPTSLVARSKIFVDSRDAAMSEAGDILVPLRECVVSEAAIIAEIGQVIAGQHPGRCSADETTLFKSLGLAIEDLVACDMIYHQALERSAGYEVVFP